MDAVNVKIEEEIEIHKDMLEIKEEPIKIEIEECNNKNKSYSNFNEINIIPKEEFFILDEHIKKEIAEQETSNNELNIKQENREQFVEEKVEKNLRQACGEKLLYCSSCDKSFSRNNVQLHTGEEPYKCAHCEENNINEIIKNVKRHIHIHTEKKSYKCLTCEKIFLYPSDLKVHNRKHTGDRPHKCTHCEKAFSRVSGLKTHIRTHTGERPHKCTHCEKAFSRLSDLKTHIRRLNGEKPYKCKHCEKIFATSSNLNQHFRTHAKDILSMQTV